MITILIVDDEKLERRGIRFLLKREGDFHILEAANGKDALGILASNLCPPGTSYVSLSLCLQNTHLPLLCEIITANFNSSSLTVS